MEVEIGRRYRESGQARKYWGTNTNDTPLYVIAPRPSTNTRIESYVGDVARLRCITVYSSGMVESYHTKQTAMSGG
jgi:hypothetical protein